MRRYHFVVTQKSLEALGELVLSNTVPHQGDLFCEHALYGHHDRVRLVAVTVIAKQLAKSVGEKGDRRKRDIEFLLELAENDPSPNIRFEVLKALSEAAPFTESKLNSVSILTFVIERVWVMMNEGSACDARCRLRALEFFETILPPEAHTKAAETTMVKVRACLDPTPHVSCGERGWIPFRLCIFEC
jgi:transcription initiation factor TFIID subunit 2